MPATNSPLNGKQTLNESPSEKEGKCVMMNERQNESCTSLNESPSEKEGKSSLPEHPELECHFPQ